MGNIGAGELAIIELIFGMIGLQIVAIIHVATGKFRSANGKSTWLLVVLLGGGIGPIIYYFISAFATASAAMHHATTADATYLTQSGPMVGR